MTRFRLGSVPYLNAKPLLYGLDRVEFDVPSRLTQRFADRQFDAALLPVFALFERGGGTIVDGAAIGSEGPVYSVILVHRGPLQDLREIGLDQASRTSVNLLRLLLRGYYELDPKLVPCGFDGSQARLIIGDPAIAFRAQCSSDWNVIDLGEAWTNWTGLPFVFACWVVRDDCDNALRLADVLREARARGELAVNEIAEIDPDPAFAVRYLTEFIRFDFGEKQRQAMAEFAARCRQFGVLEGDDLRLRVV